MPHVSLLRLYPIKGFPPVDVTEATVLLSGALALDRRWALMDARGRFVNGKNVPTIHALDARFDAAALEVTLDSRTFSLTRQGPEFAAWCGDRLGQPVTWAENAEAGFPDDLEATGPTFVSAASVRAVADWFGLDVDGARRRFRCNVEIDGVDAFWEDALYGGTVSIGGVEVQAINPCARCVVPSRDARTGEAMQGFQKRFAELRQQHLPPGISTAPFDHYYRFTVNTRIAAAEAGKVIRLGDPVS
jgi:MOSC domain-containing protein